MRRSVNRPMPAEYVFVERVPDIGRTYDRTAARRRLHQPLAGEQLERLAERGPCDRQLSRKFGRIGKGRSWPQLAGHDPASDVLGGHDVPRDAQTRLGLRRLLQKSLPASPQAVF
jgi:hypothetical protein